MVVRQIHRHVQLLYLGWKEGSGTALLPELFKFGALLASVTLIKGSVSFPSSAIAKLCVNTEVHDMGTAGLTGI
jgi:hypothetical protein